MNSTETVETIAALIEDCGPPGTLPDGTARVSVDVFDHTSSLALNIGRD
jgi:hypothetical protein